MSTEYRYAGLLSLTGVDIEPSCVTHANCQVRMFVKHLHRPFLYLPILYRKTTPARTWSSLLETYWISIQPTQIVSVKVSKLQLKCNWNDRPHCFRCQGHQCIDTSATVNEMFSIGLFITAVQSNMLMIVMDAKSNFTNHEQCLHDLCSGRKSKSPRKAAYMRKFIYRSAS